MSLNKLLGLGVSDPQQSCLGGYSQVRSICNAESADIKIVNILEMRWPRKLYKVSLRGVLPISFKEQSFSGRLVHLKSICAVDFNDSENLRF